MIDLNIMIDMIHLKRRIQDGLVQICTKNFWQKRAYDDCP